MPQCKIALLLIFIAFINSCSVYDSVHFAIGDPELEEAKYRASYGDWTGAAEVWTQVVNHGNERSAAKAAYNMAYACLVLNQPHIAIEWAKMAAYNYNFRLVNERAVILLERLTEQYCLEIACDGEV